MRFSSLESALLKDMGNGRKAALRLCLWFAYGYAKALEAGDEIAEDFLADVRLYVFNDGGVKSEASARVKTAKLVGENLHLLFKDELSHTPNDPTAIIHAMLDRAQASGITSVQKLVDWTVKQKDT